MDLSKNQYSLPWLIHGTCVIIFILFRFMNVSFFGIPKNEMAQLGLSLISISIFFSLSNILNRQKALIFVIYWLFLGFLIEYIALSTNRFTHHDSQLTMTWFGVVPLQMPFNWLIVYFATYSLTTFSSFFIKQNSNPIFTLFLLWMLDGVFIVMNGLMLEPIGHYTGAFTWNHENANFLVWNMVPLRVFLEYFFILSAFMLPIRWWQVFRIQPKKDAFFRRVSYPLFFGWSLYGAFTAAAFLVGLNQLGYFGLIVSILVTIYIIIGRKQSAITQ